MTLAVEAHPYLNMYLDIAAGVFGSGALPDLVPSATALGIAAWCWRNDTSVEAWHVATDVLMARVNLAVTKTVMDHVDFFDGVDWAGLETALTDSSWSLPDGRPIATLFGDGWPEVIRTVTERLRQWREIEENVLGPEATMRLLSMGGATGTTDRWWGQGRWTALCTAVVGGAIDADMPLPSPYHYRGSAQLIDDLSDPDLLDDNVLEWMIDLPAGTVDGPRGLRFHSAARPVVRTISPAPVETDESPDNS